MITLIFEHFGEKAVVIIDGNNLRFGNTRYGPLMADISGLKLDYAGCCREWPDLELREDWKDVAIFRFKEKLSSMSSENDKALFIVEDLKKHGYILKSKQRKGFRSEVMG